jgi:hypothetical protein
MEALHEEQRKRNEDMFGLSNIPGESDDDESDLGDPVVMLDTGDTSADGNDLLTADEVVDNGGDLLG